MRAALVLVVVVVAGCGRLGFTSTGEHDGGGSGDASASDGATGDSAAGTCSEKYDICDGFEKGLNTSLWIADQGVTLDSTFSHRGSASVRVQTPAFGPAQNMYRAIAETETIGGGATTFWIRAWFWLSALPAGGNGMELVTAERPGSEGDYVFVFANRSSLYSQFGNAAQDTGIVPVGSWFCVVFEVVRSTASTGSLGLTGDIGPVALPNVQTDSASAPMTHTTLGIGFASSNTPDAQPALELWIDDVIIHTAAVTCAD